MSPGNFRSMVYQKCPCLMTEDSQSPSINCTVYLVLHDNLVLADIGQEKISQENFLSSPELPWYTILPSFMECSPISGLFILEDIWPTSYKEGRNQALKTRAVRWVSRVWAMNFIISLWGRHLQMPRFMPFWGDCDPPCQPSGNSSGQLGATAGDGVTPEVVRVACFT